MKKFILIFSVVFCCLSSSLVISYAGVTDDIYGVIKWGLTPNVVNSGNDAWVATRNQIQRIWHSYSDVSSMAKKPISFDALSELSTKLNSDGYPCVVEYNRDLGYWVISGTDSVQFISGVSITGKYLTNGSRDLICAQFNTDSLLSSIAANFDNLMKSNGYLQSILDKSVYINAKVGSILEDFDRLMVSPSGYLANINEKLGRILDSLSIASFGDSSGGSSSVLPDEYRRLTYIETHGHQYINSSIYFDSSKSIQIDADVEFLNDSASQVLFGYLSSATSASYSLFLNPHPPTRDYCYRFGSSVITSTGAFPTGVRHNVSSYAVSGHQYLTIDGQTTLSSSESASFVGSVPCYLFASNSVSGASQAKCYLRCYGIVIRQDGVIVRNYIPAVRYSDDVPGLYDLVSGVFSPSLEQSFIAGPVLANWQYTAFNSIISRLDAIFSSLDNLDDGLDNFVVNITNDNDAYNVFYVTDSDENQKSVGTVAGDGLKASGKLLQFLYKLCFEDALSGIDDTISGLNDFYFDSAAVGEGVDLWD